MCGMAPEWMPAVGRGGCGSGSVAGGVPAIGIRGAWARARSGMMRAHADAPLVRQTDFCAGCGQAGMEAPSSGARGAARRLSTAPGTAPFRPPRSASLGSGRRHV